MMKLTHLACVFILLGTLTAPAQDGGPDRDENRSSNLTPTAPRKVTMANPNKPGWQAEPHGK